MTTAAKKTGINLLTSEFARPKGLQFLQKFSYIFLAVYSVAIVFLFAGFLVLSQQQASLDVKGSSLSADIKSLNEEEGLLTIVKNRTKLSKTTFGGKKYTRQEIIEKTVSSLSPSATLVSLGASGDSVVLTGKSDASVGVTDTFNKLKEQQFSQVTLQSLSLDAQGRRNFTIEIK